MSRYQPKIFLNNPEKTVSDETTAQFFKALMTADVDQVRQFAMNNRNKYNLVSRDKKYLTGQTPYHVVLAIDDTIADEATKLELLNYLDIMGAPMDLPDSNSQWPIHLAVATRSYKLVRFFVERFVNIERLDSSNNTPLHYAVTGKSTACATRERIGRVEDNVPKTEKEVIEIEILNFLSQDENLQAIYDALFQLFANDSEIIDEINKSINEALIDQENPTKVVRRIRSLIPIVKEMANESYLSTLNQMITAGGALVATPDEVDAPEEMPVADYIDNDWEISGEDEDDANINNLMTKLLELYYGTAAKPAGTARNMLANLLLLSSYFISKRRYYFLSNPLSQTTIPESAYDQVIAGDVSTLPYGLRELFRTDIDVVPAALQTGGSNPTYTAAINNLINVVQNNVGYQTVLQGVDLNDPAMYMGQYLKPIQIVEALKQYDAYLLQRAIAIFVQNEITTGHTVFPNIGDTLLNTNGVVQQISDQLLPSIATYETANGINVFTNDPQLLTRAILTLASHPSIPNMTLDLLYSLARDYQACVANQQLDVTDPLISLYTEPCWSKTVKEVTGISIPLNDREILTNYRSMIPQEVAKAKQILDNVKSITLEINGNPVPLVINIDEREIGDQYYIRAQNFRDKWIDDYYVRAQAEEVPTNFRFSEQRYPGIFRLPFDSWAPEATKIYNRQLRGVYSEILDSFRGAILEKISSNQVMSEISPFKLTRSVVFEFLYPGELNDDDIMTVSEDLITSVATMLTDAKIYQIETVLSQASNTDRLAIANSTSLNINMQVLKNILYRSQNILTDADLRIILAHPDFETLVTAAKELVSDGEGVYKFYDSWLSVLNSLDKNDMFRKRLAVDAKVSLYGIGLQLIREADYEIIRSKILTTLIQDPTSNDYVIIQLLIPLTISSVVGSLYRCPLLIDVINLLRENQLRPMDEDVSAILMTSLNSIINNADRGIIQCNAAIRRLNLEARKKKPTFLGIFKTIPTFSGGISNESIDTWVSEYVYDATVTYAGEMKVNYPVLVEPYTTKLPPWLQKTGQDYTLKPIKNVPGQWLSLQSKPVENFPEKSFETKIVRLSTPIIAIGTQKGGAVDDNLINEAATVILDINSDAAKQSYTLDISDEEPEGIAIRQAITENAVLKTSLELIGKINEQLIATQVVNTFSQAFDISQPVKQDLTTISALPEMEQIPDYLENDLHNIPITNHESQLVVYDVNTLAQSNINESKMCYVYDSRILELVYTARNANWRNSDGNTPLHLAVNSQNPSAVKVLVSKGNNNWTNLRGKTPLALASEFIRDPKLMDPNTTVLDCIAFISTHFNDALVGSISLEINGYKNTVLKNITYVIPSALVMYNSEMASTTDVRTRAFLISVGVSLVGIDIDNPRPLAFTNTQPEEINTLWHETIRNAPQTKHLKSIPLVNQYTGLDTEDPETYELYLQTPLIYAPSMIVHQLLKYFDEDISVVADWFATRATIINNKDSERSNPGPLMRDEFDLIKQSLRIILVPSVHDFIIDQFLRYFESTQVTRDILENARFNGVTLRQYLGNQFLDAMIQKSDKVYGKDETFIQTFIPDILSASGVFLSEDNLAYRRLVEEIVPFVVDNIGKTINQMRLAIYGYERFILSSSQKLEIRRYLGN